MVSQWCPGVSRCHSGGFLADWVGFLSGVSKTSKTAKTTRKQSFLPVLTPPLRNYRVLIEHCLEIPIKPENSAYSSLTWGISTEPNRVKHGFPGTKVQDPNSSCETVPIIDICRKTVKNTAFVHPSVLVLARVSGLTMSYFY